MWTGCGNYPFTIGRRTEGNPTREHSRDIIVNMVFSDLLTASCFLQLKEIFNFTQEDFMSDEIMIVDCYTDIFVWVGQATSPQLKLRSFDLGQVIFVHQRMSVSIGL